MGLYLKGNKGIFTLGLVGFGESLQLDMYVQSTVLTRKPPGSTYGASFTLEIPCHSLMNTEGWIEAGHRLAAED